MINKALLIVIITVFSCSLQAQNKFENNKRAGKWIQKDERDLIFAEGTYKDGIRVGRWKFFVAPVSRYVHSPDIEGTYDEYGKKTGKWTFVSSHTKIRIDATFIDDQMEGKCSYHAPNGDIMAEG